MSQFKLTYATMFNPPKELHTRFDAALAQVRADLGQEYSMLIGGQERFAEGKFKSTNPANKDEVLGLFQTGTKEEYEELVQITDDGTIIVDDSNPLELSAFIKEKDVDLFVGGVKERPIAYKLGVAFCDHNHERQAMLAGFSGMLNFAEEVYGSVMSPVWEFVPRRRGRAT